MEDHLTEVTVRFAYHPPKTEERAATHDNVREAFREFADQLDALLPECREKALALTALQESMMWTNAAVAYRMGDE